LGAAAPDDMAKKDRLGIFRVIFYYLLMENLDLTQSIVVQRADMSLVTSFHRCLDEVAREKIYIELTQAPPLDDVMCFQSRLLESGAPNVYAVLRGEVIGWCDISASKNPRLAHRGSLGMGVRKLHRGLGLGTRLLTEALAQARMYGLEKVELQVYSSNTAAIRLYEKLGFVREGLIEKYRKLEGLYFDCLVMAKFI
jgi:ribosomal protein S18 acetylase RimI-like enzyme